MTNSVEFAGVLSFTASRSALTSGDARVLPEAVAVATGQSRHSVLLRLQDSGFRVIDCWLSDAGLCMHTRVADDAESPGTHVPAELAEIHLASILASLFSPGSPTPSNEVIAIDTAALRGDHAIPPGLQSIGSAWRTVDETDPRLIVGFAHSGGLVGQAAPGAASVLMEPASAAQIWARIRGIVVGV